MELRLDSPHYGVGITVVLSILVYGQTLLAHMPSNFALVSDRRGRSRRELSGSGLPYPKMLHFPAMSRTLTYLPVGLGGLLGLLALGGFLRLATATSPLLLRAVMRAVFFSS